MFRMRGIARRVIAAAGALVLFAVGMPLSTARASDPLGPLVDEALRANLTLEGERLAERRSAAEARQALSMWLPRAGISSRYSSMDGIPNLGDLMNPAYGALNRITGTTSFPTNIDLSMVQRHETHLRLAQPILAEGIRANLSGARARHDAQREQLGAAARQIAAQAQIAYLQQASARRVVEVNEAALALAQENERVAGRLIAAGTATPEAALRARADRAAVEQELAEARQQYVAASRELNRVLGRPLDASVEATPDTAFDQPIGPDREAAIASALANREEIAQSRAYMRAAGAMKRAAISRSIPTLSVAFDYGFQGSEFAFHANEDSWTASLVAEIDLVDFTRGPARSAAGYEVERARVGARDVETRVRQDVETTYDAAVTALAAIATADARLDAARRTYELVRRRYQEGAASSLELIDARTGFTGAELNRVLTLYRYAMRRVDLERAAALRELHF